MIVTTVLNKLRRVLMQNLGNDQVSSTVRAAMRKIRDMASAIRPDDVAIGIIAAELWSVGVSDYFFADEINSEEPSPV